MKDNFFEHIKNFFENGKTNLENSTDISDVDITDEAYIDNLMDEDESKIAVMNAVVSKTTDPAL